jgi:hypothetical protein
MLHTKQSLLDMLQVMPHVTYAHRHLSQCVPAGVIPTLYFIPSSPLLTADEDAAACADLSVSRKLLLEHTVTQPASWTSSVTRNGIPVNSAIEKVGKAGKLQLQNGWQSEVSEGATCMFMGLHGYAEWQVPMEQHRAKARLRISFESIAG